MSFGPFNPSNKYAPGLGGKTNTMIDNMIRDWHKHGVGVIRDRKGKKR